MHKNLPKRKCTIYFQKKIGILKKVVRKNKDCPIFSKRLKSFFYRVFIKKKKKIFLDKKIVKKNVGFKEKGLEMNFFMRKSFIFPRKWIPWFVENQGFYSLKKKKKDSK